MNHTALLALLLVLAPAARAEHAACGAMRLRSAETFFDSIRYELRKSPDTGALLERLPAGEPAAGLAKAAWRAGAAQAELFDAAAALLPLEVLGPAERVRSEAAVKAARGYIAPAAGPACEELPSPAAAQAPADTVFHGGGTPETAGADPGLVAWKDAGGYAASRLGPLTALLDALGPGDEVWLSNLPLGALLPRLGAPAGVTALNLPVSGYAKRLWLARRPGGGAALVLSDFQGRIYLRHFELLLKRYYSGRPAPALRAAEAPSAYEPYYRALERVRAADPAALDSLEGLAAGYGEAFRVHWSSYAAGSVSDPAGDWRVDIYSPPGAGRWGVVTAHSSFYGETLGENIKYLVLASTGIRTVVLAASAGSLETRGLYDLVYPSHVRTPSGALVSNALGSAADFRPHTSALSPLEETPAWLARAAGEGVGTVDVEMGPAAGLLSPLGLRLGFAALVTDFPVHRPVTDKVLARASLASQDASAKYRNIEGYIRGLGDWLLRGTPPGWQPVEKLAGRTIAEQSALNLAAEGARLAPFSPREEALLKKLENFFRAEPPAFSVRMSRARAARVLEDEAFLSTELVSLLKGAEVKPFTPDYEQSAYRAWRYLFGTLSYWDGPEKYGDTVLRLRERAWKRRAWATRRSAMRALALAAEGAGVTPELAAQDPGLAAAASGTFVSWIVAPADLPRALALQVTGELRALPRRAFDEFAAASPAGLPALIKKHDVGWLEGHIYESVPVEEIELLKLPGPAPDISARAAALGIAVAGK